MSVAVCALTVVRNNFLHHNKGAANFPRLQPMAELRRNQRDEIGRQLLKAHYAPTQINDGARQIDHDIGAYVSYSFRTMSRVLFQLMERMKESRPAAQRQRPMTRSSVLRKGFLVAASMISPYFKNLG